MRNKRAKTILILLSSFILTIFLFLVFLNSETEAKYLSAPGQKIKLAVHEIKNIHKLDRSEVKEIKAEAKIQKEEIIEEVKGIKDENYDETFPAISIPPQGPTQKPTYIIPTQTPLPTKTFILPSPTPTDTLPIVDDRSLCAQTGGVWTMLPNSCVDSCALITNPELMCLQVITEGCDCGPYACWGGNGCIKNPISSKPLPTISPLPSPPITDPRSVPEPIEPPICIGGGCEPIFPIF